MELVAFVGNDRENWGQITALNNKLEDCDKVVLVMDKQAEGFPVSSKSKIIKIDCSKPLIELKQEMMDNLKKELSGEFEVALTLASGTGKEHMALISALINIPVGIRIVVFTREGVKFIS